MAQIVDVKGVGKVEFPDRMPKETMRQILQRKFSNAGKRTVGATEGLASIASSAIAEPVSGLAGIAGAILPGESGQGAQWVDKTAQALTYQPRTATGQARLQDAAEALVPIGEVIEGASKNLGDKAYDLTGSPLAAAAAYSAPTALMEGFGLKGLNIARKPIGGADLYAVRMGGGGVDDGMTVFRGAGEGSDDSIIKWVSPDENIAKGYAKARGGSVQKETVEINRPAMMGNASRRDKPSSLIASIIRDASKNEGYNIDSAKQARREFVEYFGDEPMDITDLWSTEGAKAVTSKMLKSLGYDAISVTEQGVDTYGLIK